MINYRKVFQNIPSITSLPFELHGNTWRGGFYIDGTKHARKHDKTVCYLHGDKVFIRENGGEMLSMFDWLLKYGGCSGNADVLRVLSEYSNENYVEFKERVRPAARFVNPSEVTRLRHRYFGTLFNYLLSYVEPKRLREIWRMYEVGVIFDTAIFWYRNQDGNVCFDSRIDYLPSGRRNKEKMPRRLFKSDDGYYNECLFGDHIEEFGPTVVVESEKTAIIGACFYPDFRWLATGGKNKAYLCRDKGYIMAPDFEPDAIEIWASIGRLWQWWDGYGVSEGEDVGDLILRKCASSRR